MKEGLIKDSEGSVCLDIEKPKSDLLARAVAIYNQLENPTVERKHDGIFIEGTPFKWDNVSKAWIHARTGSIQYGIKPYMN